MMYDCGINILRLHGDENQPGQEDGLPLCPICGAKAYLKGDTVDGFWFGWSVGCPRYRIYDGIHGQDENTPYDDRFSNHGFATKEKAIEWWIKRVKKI